MATAHQEDLVLINAATKQELKLTEKGQFYQVGNSVVIGDLYKDITSPETAILVVKKRTALKKLDSVISEAPHTRRLEDRLESNETKEPIDPSKL